MKEISNMAWSNQRINVDGHRFVNCTFHNCILISFAKHFALINCTITY